MFRIHWMHWTNESFSSRIFTSREEANIYAEQMAKRQPKRYSFYEVFSCDRKGLPNLAASVPALQQGGAL